MPGYIRVKAGRTSSTLLQLVDVFINPTGEVSQDSDSATTKRLTTAITSLDTCARVGGVSMRAEAASETHSRLYVLTNITVEEIAKILVFLGLKLSLSCLLVNSQFRIT